VTWNDVIKACNNFTEQRIQLFAWQTWVEAELQALIHRQRYWWRRKMFQLALNPNVQFYDLAAAPPAGGTAPAADLEQMIGIYWYVGGATPPKTEPIPFVQNVDAVMAAMNTGGAQPAAPQKFFVKPGSTTQIGFKPVPDQGYPLWGLYWATYIAGSEGTNLDQPLPLLPLQFHYLVLLQVLKRSALYLFGQQDPRYTTLLVELEGAGGEGKNGKTGELAKLDEYSSYSGEPQEIRPPWIKQPWMTKMELPALATR
jgi:hypothetical protein